MKSINTLKIAIISPLTERAAPLRCSLNRADAEKEMHAHWSRTIAAEPTITETRKFVQEIARFVTSRFNGKVTRRVWKVTKSSDKVAKLASLHVSQLPVLEPQGDFQTFRDAEIFFYWSYEVF